MIDCVTMVKKLKFFVVFFFKKASGGSRPIQAIHDSCVNASISG